MSDESGGCSQDVRPKVCCCVFSVSVLYTTKYYTYIALDLVRNYSMHFSLKLNDEITLKLNYIKVVSRFFFNIYM